MAPAAPPGSKGHAFEFAEAEIDAEVYYRLASAGTLSNTVAVMAPAATSSTCYAYSDADKVRYFWRVHSWCFYKIRERPARAALRSVVLVLLFLLVDLELFFFLVELIRSEYQLVQNVRSLLK